MKKSIMTRFNPARVFAYGALSATIAVGLGAFGAHALKNTLTPPDCQPLRLESATRCIMPWDS